MLQVNYGKVLIACIFITCVVGAASIQTRQLQKHFNSFITGPRTQNYTIRITPDNNIDDEIPTTGMEEEVRLTSRETAGSSYYVMGTKYKLRFRLAQPMPRLFWHKFPILQKPPPTETPTKIPTEPEEPPTEKPTTTEPPTTTTTRKPITPSNRPTSTMTTIMRPTKYSKLPLFSTLKELLGLHGSPVEANLLYQRPHAPKPKGKGFFSLLEVIKFENTKCNVSLADIRTMEGICYHEFECKSAGGIPTETCADGVGVCCIFLTSCGDTTDEAVVYFESPNYPNPVREMMICVLVVNLRKNVQQLRMDFIMFELNPPVNGDCLDDQFIVSGHNINFIVPTLCGINTGQHVYVHVGNSLENKIYLSFFARVPSGGRAFNMKVTQLESDLAPENCLQYYTDMEGILKSFNYDIHGAIVQNNQATYLNNLNYAICMKRGKEMCSVSYVMEDQGGEQPNFQIINKDEDEKDLVPDGQAGAGIFNCPDDFIAINQVRLCGERFNDGVDNEDYTLHATVRDIAAGPIVLPFRSDEEYVGRGFRLHFKQEQCG